MLLANHSECGFAGFSTGFASGCCRCTQEVSAVNAFFKNYEQTVALHRWVQRRMKADMPIPANMEEFIRMSSTDSSGLRPSAAGAPGKGRGRLGMAGQVGW
jgi:hypothetical protein